MEEITTIIEADPQDNTKAIVTTKFPDKVEVVPNVIGALKDQVDAKQKEIDETQQALDTYANGEVERRKKEFTDRIAGLEEEKAVLIQKIEDAVSAGVREAVPGETADSEEVIPE